MKIRKILASLLAMVLLFGVVACDKDGGDENIEPLDTEGYDFPLVDEVIDLKFMGSQTDLQGDLNEMWFFKAYNKASNIHVKFDVIPSESLTERRNLAILAEDQPDAYFKMGFGTTDIAKYSSQGMFVKLDEYLGDELQNFNKYLEKHPDLKVGLTMPDGGLYSTCYILDHYAITSGPKMYFNKNALEGVGKEVPQTIDELTELLRAFKDYDLNGNGTADEIPLTSSSFTGIESVLLGSFGLGNRGSSSNIQMGENGPEYIYTTDRYRELLEYEKMLYDEGLIDQDIFTNSTSDLVAKGSEGRTPAYVFVNHSIIGEQSKNSIGMSKPFTGPHGDEFWRSTGSALSGAGAFLVTKDNEHVSETLKWIDFLYSDTGIRNYFMGIKGENYESESPATYYIDDEGNYEYNKFVMENPDGKMFEEVLGTVVPWAGGGNPSVANEKYFKGGEMQTITRETSDKLEPYMLDYVWPSLVWEADEVEEMSRVSADIGTHLSETRSKFVTGTLELNDENWDKYVKTFDEMGMDTYMSIYQNAIDRLDLK